MYLFANMSIFNYIDPTIKKFAINLNARVTIDRPSYPKELATFEERRIDWIHNNKNKAIIIQPTFEVDGINKNLWNFTAIYWFYDSITGERISDYIDVLSKKEFTTIENNIDELLNQSILFLNQH